MNKNQSVFKFLLVVGICTITPTLFFADTGSIYLHNKRDSVYCDTADKTVTVSAVFHPARFNHTRGLKQHHFIVWEKGKAGDLALFTCGVPDSILFKALVSVGGVPGNNLTLDTWEKRNDKSSPDPDTRAAGSPVGIAITHNGIVYQTGQILKDLNSKDYDFRFAGNYAFIPMWRSGCIACLQSCPGGKIGNSTYTIRDLANSIPRFSVIPGIPLKEGDVVTITFTVK